MIASEVRKKLIQQPLYSHQQVDSRKKNKRFSLWLGSAVLHCMNLAGLQYQTAQGGIFCPLTTHTGLTHQNIGNQTIANSSAVNSAGFTSRTSLLYDLQCKSNKSNPHTYIQDLTVYLY